MRKMRDLRLLERLVRERTAALEQANERLFLANQVKAEFLSHMSRELRHPLDHIVNEALMVLEGGLGAVPEGQEPPLQTIIESGRALRSMVDRILELCNLDIGVSRFLPRRFSVAEALEKAVAGPRELSARQGVSITTGFRGEVGTITADEDKFAFIIEELLTNAVKFSRSGTEIQVVAREIKLQDDGEHKYLEVSVTDRGLGIQAEDLERIFVGFEKGTMAPHGRGSLGLGLTLVKRFVELHGGRIWVRSRPGEGSTFTFTLPAEGPLIVEGRTPQVLVAISDKALSQTLGEEGYEVITAHDGLEALNRGTGFPPDLFVLDAELPEMNGIEVCRRLKSHVKTSHIPVILIASQERHADRIRIAEAGADGLFIKPLDLHEMLPKLRFLVARKLNYDFLKRSYEIAETEACTDAMTGLCNIRHFWLLLERELERARRYGHSCSVAMIDVDYFKKYNDRYGHLRGDEVLKQAAELFRQHIRNSDIAARYGGEEFVVIMPETGKDLALQVGEKLRRYFEEWQFPHEETQPGGRLTISIGIATYPQDSRRGKSLIDKADKALYQAKKQGRNRVVGWGVCLLPSSHG